VILFTNSISPRLQYVTAFIGSVLKQEIRLTESRIEFSDYDGPAINYSNERLRKSELWIQPHLLVFEKEIIEQQIECFEYAGKKAYFRTGGDLPFDIFSACFYLISRYEEYLPHQKDEYGRYGYANSLAHKQGFLNKPLINYWIKDLAQSLKEIFPEFNYDPEFSFLPTYDIDEAYSFKHKSSWRSFGGSIKDILKGKFNRYRQRVKVEWNRETDPFDSYNWMDVLHDKYKLKPQYFFLVAEKNGKYDRNILPSEQAVKDLIQIHAMKYSVGVHPSWQSGDDPSLIKREKEIVQKAAGVAIDSSRQHFIRFTLPDTYRYLMDAGIRKDFSMGYGSINGFRASVASPFYWYDLENEQQTSLQIFPFCFMEANSFFEQKQTPEQAYEEMMHYYNEVRSAGGFLIFIWHNTFLGTDQLYSGWREVYLQFIKEIST